MPTSTHVSKLTTIVTTALLGLFLGAVRDARAAKPAEFQNRPAIKNLASYTYRAPVAPAAVPQGLTRREVKKLTAAATSREDHLRIAGYYRVESDKLDAEAMGYKQAAAALRHGPVVKNLMAPNTPARYEYFAKEFLQEAQSDRRRAALHEGMAEDVAATL